MSQLDLIKLRKLSKRVQNFYKAHVQKIESEYEILNQKMRCKFKLLAFKVDSLTKFCTIEHIWMLFFLSFTCQQNILAAVLTGVLGAKDPDQVNTMAKQAGEVNRNQSIYFTKKNRINFL